MKTKTKPANYFEAEQFGFSFVLDHGQPRDFQRDASKPQTEKNLNATLVDYLRGDLANGGAQ